MEVDIKTLCDKAKIVGDSIDTTGCKYGFHDRTKSYIGEAEYYSFLAGFVSVISAKQILEIGTHHGGSAMAMARGSSADTKIVTIDIVLKENNSMLEYKNIERITGNSTDSGIVKQVVSRFEPPIDLIFIDSIHTKNSVFFNMKKYKNLLPKYVIFDDIHINETMEEMWDKLVLKFPSYDLSVIVNRKNAGFGIIQLR